MFRPFQDATLLPAELSAPDYTANGVSVPSVSLSAARTADGRIVVALVNLDPNRAMPVSAALVGASAQHISGEILTAPTMDARNTFEAPDAVHPAVFTGAALAGNTVSLTLPAKSVVVLTLN